MENSYSPHKTALAVLTTLPGVGIRTHQGLCVPSRLPGRGQHEWRGGEAGDGVAKGAPCWLPRGGDWTDPGARLFLEGQGETQQHQLHPGKVLLIPRRFSPKALSRSSAQGAGDESETHQHRASGGDRAEAAKPPMGAMAHCPLPGQSSGL